MDSDRVMVLDAGILIEFDHPYKLLQHKCGFLTDMVEETGPVMSQKLRDVAWKAFHNNSKEIIMNL